ncbi:phosphotransferase family protein [Williamsia sp. 1135]|uniref:phosphotransferase family protein n=1 Tax=Williamsia sp. 1135 TaxID=1889262 RepID=UPI000A113C44|nr:phosphotransferase family protein [Williamsia sp. 1135]ORM31895.1 phosphotransferase family protein [Williamsia sp. 1135]
MNSPVGIDTEAVTTWMVGLGVSAAPPLSFQRIGNGQSNLTFLVSDSDGNKWVLRRPPLGALLASAHDVLREHRIMSALQDTPVPVPRMIATTADPDITDAPLVLMSYIDGAVIDDRAVAETLTEDHRRRIGLSLPKALGTIHAIDLESVGLNDLASHKPYAARLLKRWTGQWEKSKTRDVEAVTRVAEALAKHAPEQTELTLVHGDYHLSNVITSSSDGEVIGVVDWELCTLGDPLADLGNLLAFWPESTDPVAALSTVPTLPGFPARAEVIDAYASATGRDVSAAGYWHTMGLWRLTIIAEGILRRLMNDPRNASRDGGPTAALIDNLSERTLQVGSEAGLV